MKNTLPKWFTQDLCSMEGLIAVYNWYKYGKITLKDFQSIFDNININS